MFLQEGTSLQTWIQTAIFMLHRQVTSFPDMTRERGNMEFESFEHPSGNHIYQPPHSSCISQSQASCWWEWKSHNLSSTRRGEREWQYWEEWHVKRKTKNSILQNCWACCYGDKPPFHLFSLTCFLICCFCHMEGDLFSFSYFSVLFPHNAGLSQTPSVLLSQHPFQECVSIVSLCEEVWARPEANKLGGFEMTYIESFREKSNNTSFGHNTSLYRDFCPSPKAC